MFGLFAQGVSQKKPTEVKRHNSNTAIRTGAKGVNSSSKPATNGRPISASNGLQARPVPRSSLDRPRSEAASKKRKTASPPSRSPKKSIYKSRSHTQTPVLSSEESESEDEVETTKKRKIEELDAGRNLRHSYMFEEEAGTSFSMIHAAEIPVLDKTAKFASLLADFPADEVLELQYPSHGPKEKFKILKPLNDTHGYEAVQDIIETMNEVAKNLLPKENAEAFLDESTGYPRRVRRAIIKKEPDALRKAVKDYNTALLNLVEDGSIAKVLDSKHTLQASLVERILNQAYSRTVSLNLKLLKDYEAGTDNVYGELMPKFVSKILKEDLQLKSSQVFVDLGSGVGNVVLQAALEIGCESWGCEMMPKYCQVADLQQAEFETRAKLWGLNMGKVQLEKGNFIENESIKQVLKRADAVLVNNQVFTPATNEALIMLFLELKDGCKIVSLKSFQPDGHQITSYNRELPYNGLKVEKKDYFTRSVSWKDDGGTYYVSTKDSQRVKRFLQSHKAQKKLQGL